MFVLSLALSLAPNLTPTAFAADEGQELEEREEADAPRRAKGRGEAASQVREITRGWYGKSNVGAAIYLGDFSGAVSPGSYVGVAFGQDFVDNERTSMAWEVAFNQGLHNGADSVTQGSNGCIAAGAGPAPCTQGDLRTYTVSAAYEFSMYPTRRVGVGLRAGAGVLLSPLLMDEVAWAQTVGDYGVDPGYHNGAKPVFFGGPTLEYYTKLSHFSVGADIDVSYGLGWDLGLNTTGTVKYTF